MSAANHQNSPDITPDPWEKRASETPAAYAAFRVYVELGLDRSMPRAAAAMGKPDTYKSQLKKWSAKHGWVARAHAYDMDAIRRTSAKLQPKFRAVLARTLEAELEERMAALEKLEAARKARDKIIDNEVANVGEAFARLQAVRDVRQAAGLDHPYVQEIVGEQLADALEHDQGKGPLEILREVLAYITDPGVSYAILQALKLWKAGAPPPTQTNTEPSGDAGASAG